MQATIMQKKSRLGTLKSFIVMLNPLAYVGMYGHHIRIGYRANKKTKKFLAYHRNSTLYTMGTLILTFIINQQNSNYLKKNPKHLCSRVSNTTKVQVKNEIQKDFFFVYQAKKKFRTEKKIQKKNKMSICFIRILEQSAMNTITVKAKAVKTKLKMEIPPQHKSL